MQFENNSGFRGLTVMILIFSFVKASLIFPNLKSCQLVIFSIEYLHFYSYRENAAEWK